MNESTLWQRADEILDRLLDLPPAQRADALSALSLDPLLRDRVQRLLQAHSVPEGPLDTPLPTRLRRADAASMSGRRFGPWVIETEIGRGGMSVVYRARHEHGPERHAALKLVTLGALAGTGIERFEREHSILARLRHPNIVPLFDAGVAGDGTPWLAMGLVDGEHIDAWCDAQRLDARARVRLFLAICDAVSYAHQNLIVHRDLKPSNVLVDARGHVHLLDFGIARIADQASESTASAYRALTPGYASPEQFTGAVAATTMDVYGLGALLHRLLLDRAPMQEFAERAVRVLPKDLDAILCKALAEAPEQRYPGVDALAADLTSWLHGEPVAARKGAFAYRAGRLLRRHARLVVAVAAALALGLVATLWQAHSTRLAHEDTRQALRRAEALRDYLVSLFEVEAPGRPRGELPSTAQLLQEGERLALEAETADPRVRADLLDALIHVRLRRRDVEAASRLVEAAEAMVRNDPNADARQKARTLLRRAALEELRGEPGAALEIARRAERLLDDEKGSVPWIEARMMPALLLGVQQQPEQALAILEPLAAQIESRSDIPAGLRHRIHTGMAIALAGLGRYAEAQRYDESLIAIARSRYGERHLQVAIALTNAGASARRLGQFDLARERVDEGIAIHELVALGPSEYRGSARVVLGWLHLATGRYDDALDAFAQGNRENAQARGIEDPARYDIHHYNRGLVLAHAARWREAVETLDEARAGLAQRPAGFAALRAETAAWLARAHCALGELATGKASLAEAQHEAASAGSLRPEVAAVLDEAAAGCALAAGDAPRAAKVLEAARTRDAALAPGFAADGVRRRVLAADAARALGDLEAERRELAAAREQLHRAGLQQHPLALAISGRLEAPR